MKSDKNIRQQTLIAVLWNGMSRFGRQALSLLITILLLRILQPEDFGLFALVMLFVSLLKMLVEFGFTAVIIQGKEIDQKALSSIFWFNLINGAFFTLLIIALAPAISKYFDEPALKELIQILSLLILLSAASIVPKALIEKNLKYKFLAKIEISTIFISGATGILMAFNGFGVLSLVAQQLTQSILWFFLIWTGHNWRPLFWFSFKRILNFLTMGASLFSNYFLAFLADNLDDFLIGKKLGKYDLGLYNRGFMIISLPVNLIAHSIGQVMLASFSLIQEDKQKLRAVFLMMNRVVALFTFPIMILLIVQSPALIPLILGNQWLDMIPLFQVFCGISILASLNALLGPLIIAQGQSELIFKDGLIQKSIIIISILIGIQWGLSGVILARFLAEMINVFVTFYHAKRSIQLNIFQQIHNLSGLILINAIIFWILHLLYYQLGASPEFLVASSLVAFGLYWLLLYLFRIRAYSDLLKIIQSGIIRK